MGYENLVPLKEVLGQTLRVGPQRVRVDRLYHELLARFGSELRILRKTPPGEIESAGHPLLALALGRMRKGEVEVLAGYDGEYGTISLIKEKDFQRTDQLTLI